ncbi:MAG: efflux RND transporter periplasmic adaptor subunit, partial [Solimonas sp.]
MFKRSLILLPLLAAALAGCKPENKFQPPPPPEISVAPPLQQQVEPYEVLTGNTVAFATVDLVARVKGFLTAIKYVDGSSMKKGDV